MPEAPFPRPISPEVDGPPAGDVYADAYPARIGSQVIDLPLVPITGERAISLLMTIDRGVGFMATAGAELAALLEPARPEVVVSRHLGHPGRHRGQPGAGARRLRHLAEDTQDPPGRRLG